MPDPAVKLKFFGDTDELEKAVIRMEKKLEDLKNKNRGMARKQPGGFGKQIKTWAASLGGVALGYRAISGTISIIGDANRQLIKDAQSSAKLFDSIFRKFRVQSGLRGIEAKGAQKTIIDAALKYPVSDRPIVAAEATARQAVSSGVPVENIERVLPFLLKLQGASNIAGADADPVGMTKGLVSYASSQGLPLNQKSFSRIGKGTQQLFRDTNIQLKDLSELSEVASVMKGKLSVEEQLGTFGTIVSFNPNVSKAKTHFKRIVTSLGTARARAPGKRALKTLGINPDQVDLVGEGLADAFDVIGPSLERQPEKLRLAIIKDLVGDVAAPTFLRLVEMREQVRKNTAIVANAGAGFEGDVTQAFGGRVMAERRLDIEKKVLDADRDTESDLLLKQLQLNARSKGMSAGQRGMREFAFNRVEPWLGGQTAARIGFGDINGSGGEPTTGFMDWLARTFTFDLGRGDAVPQARADIEAKKEVFELTSGNDNDTQGEILNTLRQANEQRASRPINRNANGEN